mmetsp:Transcript_25752/g.85828  ORF Transcript_25752/g.85828 Transcript_25752/m.85828 type:complete len:203 (+) Transcript_25752:275-883(+)
MDRDLPSRSAKLLDKAVHVGSWVRAFVLVVNDERRREGRLLAAPKDSCRSSLGHGFLRAPILVVERQYQLGIEVSRRFDVCASPLGILIAAERVHHRGQHDDVGDGAIDDCPLWSRRRWQHGVARIAGAQAEQHRLVRPRRGSQEPDALRHAVPGRSLPLRPTDRVVDVGQRGRICASPKVDCHDDNAPLRQGHVGRPALLT